jgi:lysophospholipase L1-like esterase
MKKKRPGAKINQSDQDQKRHMIQPEPPQPTIQFRTTGQTSLTFSTVIKWGGLLLVLPHIAIILITGKIFSTPLLTIGMYLFICWGMIALIKVFKLNDKLILSVILFSSLMMGLELWLRFGKKMNLGYLEKNGGWQYISNYRFHNLWNVSYSPNNKPNSIKTDKRLEFTYTYRYNNRGFRGPDILSKKPSEYRICAIGDSFTESVGSPDDSTWSQLLQHKLTARYGTVINVINLGRSGSDPVYNLKAFQDNLINLNPDMLLLNINNSDLDDIISRGGPERYNKNGRLQLRTGPWWEYFYGYSYIVRFFIRDVFQYNWLLSRPSQDPDLDDYPAAADKLYATVMQMHEYCQSKQIEFVLMVTPLQFEMEYGHLNNSLSSICLQWYTEDKFQIIFLPSLFLHNGMTPENVRTYYWRLDSHFNSRGYELIAQCVAEKLEIPGKAY